MGETAFVKGTERTAVDMMLEASRRAIADAGLKPSDIDGMVPPPIYTTSEEMAANLGIDVLRYAATVHMGGASPTTALQNAAMAISSGLCNHVLVTLGWNGYSALRQKPGAPPTRPMNMNTLTNTIQGYYIPYGVFCRCRCMPGWQPGIQNYTASVRTLWRQSPLPADVMRS